MLDRNQLVGSKCVWDATIGDFSVYTSICLLNTYAPAVVNELNFTYNITAIQSTSDYYNY